MLNVTPDHIDRHGTIEHYAAVKSRILGRAGCGIIGVDDDYGRGMAKNLSRHAAARSCRFRSTGSSRMAMSAASATSIAPATSKQKTSPISPASARCAAAITCRTRSRRLPPVPRLASTTRRLQEGLRTFPGLAHRMEEIGKKGAVLFINDSKATNADSAAKALASFEQYLLDRRRAAERRRNRRAWPNSFRASPRPIWSARRRAISHKLSTARCRLRNRRDARCGCGARRPRCGRGRPAGRGAALAGLRLVRPVPEFRGAGEQIQGPGARAFWPDRSEAPRRPTFALAGGRNPPPLIKPKPRRVTLSVRGPLMISRTRLTPFAVWWWTIDRLTLAALGALMLAGIILLLAASSPVASKLGLDPFHFVNRQIMYLLPAIAHHAWHLASVAAPDSPAGAGGVRRQHRAAGWNAGVRHRDQGRAALDRAARRQHSAVRIRQARLRDPDRLAVRRIRRASPTCRPTSWRWRCWASWSRS